MTAKLLSFIFAIAAFLSPIAATKDNAQNIWTFYQPVVCSNTEITSSAEGMALIEANSNRVIYTHNANKKLPIASTTKIATAITVIENCKDLNKVYPIPKRAVGVEGSSIYLQEGESMAVSDLLYGLMLRSGNDCAVALAIIVGGTEENFVAMMNKLATKIGLQNTNFTNPHGLHDDNHFSSAYDMALIASYAMKNSIFRDIVGSKKHIIPKTTGEYDRVLINKNKLLSLFDGANGIKTGYTKKSGRCLVASSERNGMETICVVLNCGDMWDECSRLMDKAHNAHVMSDIISDIQPIAFVKIVDGRQEYVPVGCRSHEFPLTKDELERLTYTIELPENLLAPIEEGKEIGKISFYLDKQLIFEEKLFTIYKVDKVRFIDKLRRIFTNKKPERIYSANKQILGRMWCS